MKKIFKFTCVFLSIMMVMSMVYNIFAFGNGFDPNLFPTENPDVVNERMSNSAEKIFGTIATIVQVLAVAGIVILGVRYMFAGASDKANIKQTLIYAIIGLVLVFSASTVLKIFMNAGDEFLNNAI